MIGFGVVRNIAVPVVLVGAMMAASAYGESSMSSSAAKEGPASASTINDSVPPGQVTRLTEQNVMLRAVTAQGEEELIIKGVRPAGTRAPIHTHPYGGSTCVLEGAMTLYMQDSAPVTKSAGSCYYMPPGMAMSGANEGTVPAVLIDWFITPKGIGPWKVIEPGHQDIADQFGGD